MQCPAWFRSKLWALECQCQAIHRDISAKNLLIVDGSDLQAGPFPGGRIGFQLWIIQRRSGPLAQFSLIDFGVSCSATQAPGLEGYHGELRNVNGGPPACSGCGVVRRLSTLASVVLAGANKAGLHKIYKRCERCHKPADFGCRGEHLCRRTAPRDGAQRRIEQDIPSWQCMTSFRANSSDTFWHSLGLPLIFNWGLCSGWDAHSLGILVLEKLFSRWWIRRSGPLSLAVLHGMWWCSAVCNHQALSRELSTCRNQQGQWEHCTLPILDALNRKEVTLCRVNEKKTMIWVLIRDLSINAKCGARQL